MSCNGGCHIDTTPENMTMNEILVRVQGRSDGKIDGVIVNGCDEELECLLVWHRSNSVLEIAIVQYDKEHYSRSKYILCS